MGMMKINNFSFVLIKIGSFSMREKSELKIILNLGGEFISSSQSILFVDSSAFHINGGNFKTEGPVDKFLSLHFFFFKNWMDFNWNYNE